MKNKFFIPIAIPVASNKPLLKGFNGIMLINNQLMEFGVISDVVSKLGENETRMFEMEIETPLGNMEMRYVWGDETVKFRSSANDSWCETSIYTSDKNAMEKQPAVLSVEMRSAEIQVPVEDITVSINRTNQIKCAGYSVENDIITKVEHYINYFKIDKDGNIYDYDCGMENMLGSVEEASEILLGKHIVRLKK